MEGSRDGAQSQTGCLPYILQPTSTLHSCRLNLCPHCDHLLLGIARPLLFRRWAPRVWCLLFVNASISSSSRFLGEYRESAKLPPSNPRASEDISRTQQGGQFHDEGDHRTQLSMSSSRYGCFHGRDITKSSHRHQTNSSSMSQPKPSSSMKRMPQY